MVNKYNGGGVEDRKTEPAPEEVVRKTYDAISVLAEEFNVPENEYEGLLPDVSINYSLPTEAQYNRDKNNIQLNPDILEESYDSILAEEGAHFLRNLYTGAKTSPVVEEFFGGLGRIIYTGEIDVENMRGGIDEIGGYIEESANLLASESETDREKTEMDRIEEKLDRVDELRDKIGEKEGDYEEREEHLEDIETRLLDRKTELILGATDIQEKAMDGMASLYLHQEGYTVAEKCGETILENVPDLIKKPDREVKQIMTDYESWEENYDMMDMFGSMFGWLLPD